jgi:hydrogenase nickel incorporation protein HypB
LKINVVQNVLAAGEKVAEANRARMDAAGVRAINLMSAPGSGKTTLLTRTIPALAPLRAAVLVGDLQTTRDAERLAETGAPVTQINTGRGCHLSPDEVACGLDSLDLDAIDLLFIENVGNMVCPAAFDIGEHVRAVLLSVPEGDDKVAKYPTLFQQAGVVLLTKVDLIGPLPYDRDLARSDLAKLNTAAPLIELSNETGEGIDEWLDWLRGQVGKGEGAE